MNEKNQKTESAGRPRIAAATSRRDVADNDRLNPAHAIAELALIRVDAVPTEETLRRVAELARSSLGHVLDVSFTLLEEGQPRSVVFTGALAVDLDERQYEMGFGPCVDAARTCRTIAISADSDDSPYRDFARLAARAGVQYSVAVGMRITERIACAMNVYCRAEPADAPDFMEHAEIFSAYATVVINNLVRYNEATDHAANLLKAMESRAVIEQAKGIIMARDRCTPDDAFDTLRRISQQQNVKLRNVAEAIVEAARKAGIDELDLSAAEQVRPD